MDRQTDTVTIGLLELLKILQSYIGILLVSKIYKQEIWFRFIFKQH